MEGIKMHSLADIYNNQNKKNNIEKEKQSSPQINLVLHMPEVSNLIKHLDLLYSKIIINNMEQQNNKSISYFNPGQGAVRQSDQVQ